MNSNKVLAHISLNEEYNEEELLALIHDITFLQLKVSKIVQN
jgi:hypothetical protein